MAVGYVAIVGIVKDDIVKIVVLTSANASMNQYSTNIVMEQNLSGVVANGYVPLNFSVSNGVVVWDAGSRERLKKSRFVVISRRDDDSFRCACVDNSGMPNPVSVQIVPAESVKKAGSGVFHNAIMRNDYLACYPNHPFLPESVKQRVQKPEKVEKPATAKADKTKAPAKPATKKPVVPKEDDGDADLNFYTKEQKHELAACRKAGIDNHFMRNPDLSAKQMRVLWMSKKNKGTISEAIANPALSEDAMKFYADRLLTMDVVNKCRDMLAHPELSTEHLAILFQCIYRGFDYRDLIQMSETDASVAYIEMLQSDQHENVDVGDIMGKAVNVALKMQGV